jgi:hypothetical protein
LGGIAGADAAGCQDSATDAGLSGNWRAWLSTDTQNARDRIPEGEYRLLDVAGTVIANNKADLTDGTLDAPIQVDAKGVTMTQNFGVWTGTVTNGTNSGVGNCNDWRSGAPNRGLTGFANDTGGNWTDNQEEGCDDDPRRLYCFSVATSN